MGAYVDKVAGVRQQLEVLSKVNAEQVGWLALDNKLDTLNKLVLLLAQMMAAQVDLMSQLPKPEAGASVLKQGSKTVASTTTSEKLLRPTPCLGVHVHAMISNTGLVYVGNESVRSDIKGHVLYTHESVWIPIDDVSKVSIAVSVAGEGVDFFYLQEVDNGQN